MQQGLLGRIGRNSVEEYHAFGITSEGQNALHHYIISNFQGKNEDNTAYEGSAQLNRPLYERCRSEPMLDHLYTLTEVWYVPLSAER